MSIFVFLPQVKWFPPLTLDYRDMLYKTVFGTLIKDNAYPTCVIGVFTQRAHDVEITSNLRPLDVFTSHRHQYDVSTSLLAAGCYSLSHDSTLSSPSN